MKLGNIDYEHLASNLLTDRADSGDCTIYGYALNL